MYGLCSILSSVLTEINEWMNIFEINLGIQSFGGNLSHYPINIDVCLGWGSNSNWWWSKRERERKIKKKRERYRVKEGEYRWLEDGRPKRWRLRTNPDQLVRPANRKPFRFCSLVFSVLPPQEKQKEGKILIKR